MSVQYLDQTGLALRAGLSAATVRSYRSRGYLPNPDAMIGDRAGWTEASIDAWLAARPGRTGRPRKARAS